ncbi:MAG: DUF3597 domain-containing protein [Rhizobiaceae bacterium]|nr:DUF3597 domain-containing protein [Rhizobiaceae bacterium]
MGIFSSIKDKLFGKKAAPDAAAPTETAAVTEATTPVSADLAPKKTGALTGDGGPAGAKAVASATQPAATASAPAATVDVAAILDAAVKANGQKLDWKRSIVDLMKALDLDSSLAARKELADELNYTGDKNDSATMNVWLHKALMKALAENGGKVPAELLD